MVTSINGFEMRCSLLHRENFIYIVGLRGETLFIGSSLRNLYRNWAISGPQRLLDKCLSCSRTSALHCSSTSAEVEQPGFQSSVSEHGVELLQIWVRVRVVASDISRAKSQCWGQIWPKRWQICNLQILVNYTKYYTAAIFCNKSLIYKGFLVAWISVNP